MRETAAAGPYATGQPSLLGWAQLPPIPFLSAQIWGTAAAVARKAIVAGLHDGRRLGFLQQEGVFWSYALWRKAGGLLNSRLKLAGDFDLWRRFAEHAPCHALNSVTGFFRRHEGGLSSNIQQYFDEVDGLLSGDAASRRDAVLQELTQLAARNDREGLARAGFLGPVVLWNSETCAWERKTALINVRRPDVLVSRTTQ